MPGSTSLGIPYPLQGEVISATQFQNMSTAVDALFTQLDTLRDLAGSKPSAGMTGGSVATATGVNGTVANYTTIQWDTAGYCNLGTHPNSFVVPPGVYWASCGGNLSGATTVATKRLMLLFNSIIWGSQATDVTSGTGNGTMSVSSGVIVATAPTNTIEVRTFWSGTGGPATTQFVDFRIYQIRALADV